MPEPIRQSAIDHDLSPRFGGSSTVQGSPIAAAAETVIATVTIAGFGDTTVQAGIRLQGWASFTVGTNGTAATLRIRKTDINGAVVVTSGALTAVAANVMIADVLGSDATPGVGTYALTLQITGGSANTTIGAVHLSWSNF